MNQPPYYFQPARSLAPSALVNEATALALPGISKGIHVIAHGTAVQAPPLVYLDNRVASEQPQFIQRLHPGYTNYSYFYEAVSTAILHGNWVGLIQRDENGTPLSISPVHPSYAQPLWHPTTYVLTGWRIGDTKYSPDDVLHVKGFTLPSQFEGVGLLDMHKRGLSIAMDINSFISGAVRSGGLPSVVLQQSPNAEPITQDQADAAKKRWNENHGGPVRGVSVLPPDLTLHELSNTSPADMETQQLKNQIAAELLLMLGLDPSEIGASMGSGSGTEYANITDRIAARYADAISPWTTRFAQSLDDLVPGEGTVKFQIEKLIEPDEEKRNRLDLEMVNAGVMTKDEYRAKRGWDPLPEVAPIIPVVPVGEEEVTE